MRPALSSSSPRTATPRTGSSGRAAEGEPRPARAPSSGTGSRRSCCPTPSTRRPASRSSRRRMTFVEIADDVDAAEILGPTDADEDGDAPRRCSEALLADGDWHESDGVRSCMAAAGFTGADGQAGGAGARSRARREGFPAVTWWRLPGGSALVGPAPGSESGPTADSVQPSRLDGPESPVGRLGPSSTEAELGGTEAGVEDKLAARLREVGLS